MEQFILVIKNRFALCEKVNNQWKKRFEAECIYGKNGYSKNRREGDMTTPIGIFKLMYAFGIEENPGAKIEYRKITKNSYYTLHNKWIESEKQLPGEHLIEYEREYKYGIVIGFNINPYVKGKGSAIFLHCKGDKDYTSGCIAVEEQVMIYLLKIIKKNAYIVIR